MKKLWSFWIVYLRELNFKRQNQELNKINSIYNLTENAHNYLEIGIWILSLIMNFNTNSHLKKLNMAKEPTIFIPAF